MALRGKMAAIDLDELERLSALQCTDEELASWFRVSTRTIERRRRQLKFAEAMERGKARGRMSIRRAQMKMLEDGNATMGIWLGKQYLGQTDEVHHRIDNATYVLAPVTVNLSVAPRDVVDIEGVSVADEPIEIAARLPRKRLEHGPETD
jgi:hypothetical protein